MRAHSIATFAFAAGISFGVLAIEALKAQSKPPAYAVLEVDPTNLELLQKEYGPGAAKLIKDGGGKYLARGGKTATFDGEPPKPRVIIVAFDSLEKAEALFTSAAYRENRKIGEKYAKFRAFGVEGLAP